MYGSGPNVFSQLLTIAQVKRFLVVFQKEPTVKEELDLDSDSPRKGRSGARGKEDSVSTPTTRKAVRDDVNRMSATKDSKSAALQKDAGKVTPSQKDVSGGKSAVKDVGRTTPGQKDSPAKTDKNKQDDKKKADKVKDVKKEKDEEKSKTNEDTKKKKTVSL